MAAPQPSHIPSARPDPLSFHAVSFAYPGGHEVVRNVTAEVACGRLTILLGPNGAGKSTLLQLAMGHLKPTAGKITVAGSDLGSMRHEKRAELISFVPQRASIGFAFSVEEVVRMGRYALPTDERAIEEALSACDLQTIRRRSLSVLSFGQQQRALLARALAQSAGGGIVMLLDEPGSAMDLRHLHDMMHHLQRIAKTGMAVLVVLHDLNLAARYADDVWLLDQGELVLRGGWNEVLQPRVLEPVYRVSVRNVHQTADGRPVFDIQPA